jgi:hypothetical protein
MRPFLASLSVGISVFLTVVITSAALTACTDGRTTTSQAQTEHVADCLCACPGLGFTPTPATPTGYVVSAYCGPGEVVVDQGCGATADATIASVNPLTSGTLQGVACHITPTGPNGAARAWAACQPAE